MKYYRQNKNNTCGIASLRMGLSLFNKNINEKSLSSMINLLPKGCAPTDLQDIIMFLKGKSIIKQQACIKDIKHYLSNGWGVIVGLGKEENVIGHYVIIKNIKANIIIYNDPAIGPNKKYNIQYFNKYLWNLGSHRDGKKVLLAFRF